MERAKGCEWVLLQSRFQCRIRVSPLVVYDIRSSFVEVETLAFKGPLERKSFNFPLSPLMIRVGPIRTYRILLLDWAKTRFLGWER